MKTPPNNLVNILIVDDDSAVRELLLEVLSQNYLCNAADSAEAAVAMLEHRSYAAVISDIDLPEMSGIELMPLIQETSPDTVIVMMSGNLSADIAERTKLLGASEFISKPFKLEVVELAVRRAVERHLTLTEIKSDR